MEVEIIIADAIKKFREYGYDVKVEYTMSSSGEVISVKLVFCGRFD